MSLISALSHARSSLGTLSQQSAVVSRNIANVDDPTATRKAAVQSTGFDGSPRVTAIARSQNGPLYRDFLTANANKAAGEARVDLLDRLHAAVGTVEDGTSPAAKLTGLQNALATFAASPDSAAARQAVGDAADDLDGAVGALKQAGETAKADADVALQRAAGEMTDLLADLKTVNDAVVKGTAAGDDVTDLQDRRDRIVEDLSGYAGLSTYTRAENDLVVQTDSGAMLFETSARDVNWNAEAGRFTIDGVRVDANGTMPLRGGSIAGLMEARDFAQNGIVERMERFEAALADYPVSDGEGEPPNLDLLEAARTIATGTEGTKEANRMIAALEVDAVDGRNPSAFLADTVGLLQAQRSSAADGAAVGAAKVERARTALADRTGINLDDEMTRLLDLERSYQASSRLISTVNQMFDSLLRAV